MRGTQERETIVIWIRNRLLAAIGLLLGALPTVAFAQLEETAERRAACMVDAIMLCTSAIPNKALIASCLASKLPRLSPQCRAQFAAKPGVSAAHAQELKGDGRHQSLSGAQSH
jgi:hypothetical protein